MFKQWELVLSELRRELDALIKKFDETKNEEKPAPRKPQRFSLNMIGLLTLIVMMFVSVVIFGAVYYKHGTDRRRLVVAVCTIIPVISLALIIFFLFFRKKIELPLTTRTTNSLVSELDNFAKRYEACVLQFV